jgi:hypothetical protein
MRPGPVGELAECHLEPTGGWCLAAHLCCLKGGLAAASVELVAVLLAIFVVEDDHEKVVGSPDVVATTSDHQLAVDAELVPPPRDQNVDLAIRHRHEFSGNRLKRCRIQRHVETEVQSNNRRCTILNYGTGDLDDGFCCHLSTSASTSGNTILQIQELPHVIPSEPGGEECGGCADLVQTDGHGASFTRIVLVVISRQGPKPFDLS